MSEHTTAGDPPRSEPGSTFAAKERPAATREDLSAELAGAVDRLPGEVVRCTRVGDTNYRCNWWSAAPTGAYDNPGMSGLVVTTHRVRRSRFLHAAKVAGRLVIEDRGRDTAG